MTADNTSTDAYGAVTERQYQTYRDANVTPAVLAAIKFIQQEGK